MKIRFAKRIQKDFKKIDSKTLNRIKDKLLWFLEQDDPLDFAEFLTNSQIGHYRFRVGDYRIIFDVEQDCIQVNKIGHRRDIY